MKKVGKLRDQEIVWITNPPTLSSKRVKRLKKVGEPEDWETKWIISPLALSSKRVKRLRKVLDGVRIVVLISI